MRRRRPLENGTLMTRFLPGNMVNRIQDLERTKRQLDRIGLTSDAAENSYSRRYRLDGWGKENLTATASATQLYRFGNTEVWQRAVIFARGGRIRGLSIAVNSARTAGTATVEIYVGGVASGVQAVLDAAATLVAWEPAVVSFEAGEAIELYLTTASWGPTSADLQASIEVEFD